MFIYRLKFLLNFILIELNTDAYKCVIIIITAIVVSFSSEIRQNRLAHIIETADPTQRDGSVNRKRHHQLDWRLLLE